MTTTAQTNRDYDATAVPEIVLGSIKLGLIEAGLVLLFSLGSRFLGGPLETILCAIVLIAGLAAVTLLPGLWTRPRTIEGLAGAAGIGLGAAGVFLLVDVVLLQNIGTYSSRWYEIGGGSNWWYHPVWWMVGSFLPWMGAWMLANHSARGRRSSPLTAFGVALGLAVLVAVLAIVLKFPGAHWSVGTFAVAFLPGLVIATLLSAIGERRA
jgi:hypothetical protein